MIKFNINTPIEVQLTGNAAMYARDTGFIFQNKVDAEGWTKTTMLELFSVFSIKASDLIKPDIILCHTE